MKKCYLVIVLEWGDVLAVFADKEDAKNFASQIKEATEVEERTMFYGQPSNRGYNK